MPCAFDRNLAVQAQVDEMSDAEADQFLARIDRRAETARQREYASRYPIWRSLLKRKLDKLDQRNRAYRDVVNALVDQDGPPPPLLNDRRRHG
jgi:hypothetical protein